MINHTLVNAVLRGLGEAVVACTTVVNASITATATGYARSAGSFESEGFVVGMEAAPFGYTQDTPALITAVTPTILTVKGPRVAQAAGSGRGVRVGLPTFRVYDNEEFTRVQDRWYVEGEYSPSAAGLSTVTASRGHGDAFGEYYWRLYGIAGKGDAAFNAISTALLKCYPPGSAQALTDGSRLRIRSDMAPYRGSIRADSPGFSVLTITVPWSCSFTNPVL